MLKYRQAIKARRRSVWSRQIMQIKEYI